MVAVLLRAGLVVGLVSLVAACGGGSEPAHTTSTTLAPAAGSAPTKPSVAVEDDAEYELDVIAEAEPDEGEQETCYLYRKGVELVRGEFSEATWQMFWRTAVDGNTATVVAAELDHVSRRPVGEVARPPPPEASPGRLPD